MKLTKETLKQIIKEELKKVANEASEEVEFTIGLEVHGIEIKHGEKSYDGNGFVKKFPKSAGRIKALRDNIYDLKRAQAGKRGADVGASVKNFESNIEVFARAIAETDLGESRFKVTYR